MRPVRAALEGAGAEEVKRVRAGRMVAAARPSPDAGAEEEDDNGSAFC